MPTIATSTADINDAATQRQAVRTAIRDVIADGVQPTIDQIEGRLPPDHPAVTDEDLQRELGRLYERGQIVYSGGVYQLV